MKMFLLIFCNIVILVLAQEPSNVSLSESYGEGYGTEWIFFPDGEGVPYFVPLASPAFRLSLIYYEYAADDIEDLVQFRFHTGNSFEEYILLDKNAEPIQDNSIQDNLPIPFSRSPFKIITHGWQSSADTEAVTLIADAYLQTSSYNVISIDWSQIAGNLLYPIVASNTKPIGDLVAQFLKALRNVHGVDKMHLIGHSLGAHVMGIAAYGSKLAISRITGLDAARPLFEYPHRDQLLRLDAGDAQFVDVIHTCAGVLGFQSPLGNVDFYPNGGDGPQPGCGKMINLMESCSHSRAYVYFAESITQPRNFPAYPCKDWIQYMLGKCKKNPVFMGDAVDRKARGDYFLYTNSESPFGQGENKYKRKH